MNVRELIEILHDLHGDTEIIIKDMSTDTNYGLGISQPCGLDRLSILQLDINTRDYDVDN